MQAVALIEAPWRNPADVVLALAGAPWTAAFLSSGGEGWSYVMAEPDATLVLAAVDDRDPFAEIQALAGEACPSTPGGPPFQGGVAGLASYELADRVEDLGLQRLGGWPDLACARYPALLAFDHARRRTLAVGRGHTRTEAQDRSRRAQGWLELPASAAGPPRVQLTPDDPAAYEDAVARIVARIHAGEIFQANIARRWRGLMQGAEPADLLAALAGGSPAPFASFLQTPDRAVVSNSPERFLRVEPDQDGFLAETLPIKGTARRGRYPEEDAALAAGLAGSEKDRAENLMIVDLMRNDLARVCTPGGVKAPELFRIATFANVHHLVSRVTGRLAPGRTAVDLLRAAFPPGSITGAPKVQAMKVIAEQEAPRGPFFGSMFQLGFDGRLDSSVLIRTAAFVRQGAGWEVEARAGAGIVADSDPASERRETEAKISALLEALAGPAGSGRRLDVLGQS